MGATLIDDHQSLVGSTTPSTITLQNSSRSAADLPLFSCGVHPLYGSAYGGATDLHTGDRPQILTPLCCRVRKGCSLRSASSSLLAHWSILGFEPGLFLGASDRPSSSILA